MRIGLNIFVTALPLSDEGIILPQLVSDPSVTGDGLEGTSLVADATDVWTYDNVQANVAERQYRLLIDSVEVDGPQSEETVSIPLNTVGSSYMMQLRVQVTAAQGVWSAWRAISGGTVTGLPVLISATGTAVGETSYNGAVTTDTGGGTLYWAVTGTATAPAIGALKSAESQAISSAGQQDVTGNGLSADSSYHIHFIQENGSGLDSNIISSSAFVTNAPQATDPAAFGAGDWSISDLATGGDARVIVTALPDDGGDALKTIEYRIAAGAWAPLSVAATGSYDLLDLFTDGSATDVRLRATNLVGAGPDGVAKSVTTSPAATAPAAFGAGDWSISDLATGGDARVIVTALPGDGGSAITGIEYLIGSGAWVALGGAVTGSYDLLDLFTDGSATDVRLRAINAIGTGAPSNVESITTSAPSSAEISITGATFTAGAGGLGPSLNVTISETDSTPDYTLYGATHANGTTLTKTDIENGTGDAVDTFTATASTLNGLDGDLTLATGLTDGHVSIFIRDSVAVESDVFKEDGVTLDATVPAFSSGAPTDGATDVAADAVFVLTFSESVFGAVSGGEFYLYNMTGAAIAETFDVDNTDGDAGGTVAVSGTTVTITPGVNMAYSNDYSIRWNAGAVTDASENPVAANTGDTLYNVSTEAAPATTFVNFVGASNYVNTVGNPTFAVDLSDYAVGDKLIICFGCNIGSDPGGTVDGTALPAATLSRTSGTNKRYFIYEYTMVTGDDASGIDIVMSTTGSWHNLFAVYHTKTGAIADSLQFNYGTDAKTGAVTPTQASNAIIHFNQGEAARFNGTTYSYTVGISAKDYHLETAQAGSGGAAGGHLLNAATSATTITWTNTGIGNGAGALFVVE